MALLKLLCNVNSWLVANKLTLNITETTNIIMKQFTETPNITIGRHSIKQVTNKKVLGIILDDELKWNEHNDEQCKKISKSICLKRSRRYVKQNSLINIYNSLVLPPLYLLFKCIEWCTHLNQLYKLQKRAAPVITVSSYDIRSKEIFAHLEWEPIENILRKREISMTFNS